jgi:tetratricopeptide (TPR) repeat protein
MGLKRIVWVGIIAIVAMSCGAPKVMTSYKTEAESFTSSENYTQATEAWKQYFDQTPVEEIAGSDFARAAKTAFKNGDADLALSWFDQARYKNYADAEMYATLAKIFRGKKNISKELDALEYITENFSENAGQIDSRLFEVYFEIDATEKALNIWEKLDETSKNDISKLNSYFLIQEALKDTAVCDSVSLVLLEKDANNVEALEWNAKKLYWLGENRYQSEMEKYEKKKTTRQYKLLLKELDLATADLKKSLAYFEKLWEIQPGKQYASYFANIYARFGDEKKSKSYQKYLK